MKQPSVFMGDWIYIQKEENGPGVHGYVFDIYKDGTLTVGYYQNKSEAVLEDVIWSGSYWQLKNLTSEIYLRGFAAKIVEKGPYRQF